MVEYVHDSLYGETFVATARTEGLCVACGMGNGMLEYSIAIREVAERACYSL